MLSACSFLSFGIRVLVLVCCIQACYCEQGSQKKYDNWSDVDAHVKIVKKCVNSELMTIIYDVQYMKIYKSVENHQTLPTQLFTSTELNSCGVPFLNEGMEYLISAKLYRRKNGTPRLYITLCKGELWMLKDGKRALNLHHDNNNVA